MASRLKITSSETCVVMFVDMVSSTKTACQIGSSDKLRLFYETFINTLSDIATSHGATIVKNGGDSIICCFPKTQDCLEKSAFREMLVCALEIISAHKIVNFALQSAGLPTVSYRVSADYGRHEVVKDPKSDTADLFSPTMNLCAKINCLSPPNSVVIGSDLYEIVKSFSDFMIRGCGEYRVNEKRAYPVFAVSKKCEKDNLNDVLADERARNKIMD